MFGHLNESKPVGAKIEETFQIWTQGPEEMCLSLEYQNPSKTSEIMGYFDRVTVSLHVLYTANQVSEGSQDRPFFYSALRASVAMAFGRASGDVLCASEAMACGY